MSTIINDSKQMPKSIRVSVIIVMFFCFLGCNTDHDNKESTPCSVESIDVKQSHPDRNLNLTKKEYDLLINSCLLKKDYERSLFFIRTQKDLFWDNSSPQEQQIIACTEVHLLLFVGQDEEAVQRAEEYSENRPNLYPLAYGVNLKSSRFARCLHYSKAMLEHAQKIGDDDNMHIFYLNQILAYLGMDELESAAETLSRLKELPMKGIGDHEGSVSSIVKMVEFMNQVEKITQSPKGSYSLVVPNQEMPEPVRNPVDPDSVIMYLGVNLSFVSNSDQKVVFSMTIK